MPTTAAPDDRLLDPLARLRGAIRRYVALEGVAFAAGYLVLWLWFGLLADYGLFRLTGWDWVMEVPQWLRAAVLWLVGGTLVVLLIRRVMGLVLGEYSDRSLALVLERRFPEQLGDRLITAVDLADVKAAAPFGYSPELIRYTVNEAAERVNALPLDRVLDYPRLRKAFLRPLTWLAIGGGVSAALVAVHTVAVRPVPPATAVRGAALVAKTWAERNLLLRYVPWPRRVQLEVLDFPESGERRVGRDGADPVIRVRANKWVVADEAAPEGWRAIRWGDLRPLGVKPPAPPLNLGTGVALRLTLGAGLQAVGGPVIGTALALPLTPRDAGARLPADLPSSAREWDAWRVDRVEQAFGPGGAAALYLGQDSRAVREVRATLARLSALTAAGGRVRELEVPADLKLSWWGRKTSTDQPLRRDEQNEYAGPLRDLKESVYVRASAADESTRDYTVTLVARPLVARLRRTEARPAYLSQRPLPEAYSALFGKRVSVPDIETATTSARSRVEVVTGTDITFDAEADKPLKGVSVLPKAGRFPGADTGEPLPIPVPLGKDGKSFRFDLSGPTRALKSTEFEFVLLDADGVRSRHLVQVQPVDDRAPEVEASLDDVRKVGAVYMVTPAAALPVNPDSRVRDDHGLNRVDYRFRARELEPGGVSAARATVAAGLFAPPGGPPLTALLVPAAYLRQYRPLMDPATAAATTRVEPVDDFVKLLAERATGERPMVAQFDFRSSGPQAFDLRQRLPDLEAKPGKPQPRYRVDLTLTATDTNVDAYRVGDPGVSPAGRVGENAETFGLLVVPEADLLNEISREEEQLAGRLDAVLVRLRDAEAKLAALAPRLPTTPDDQLLPTSTRVAEVVETVTNGKPPTEELSKRFDKILREYKLNRCAPAVIDRASAGVCEPLRSAVEADFPALAAPLGDLGAALSDLRRPDAATASAALSLLRKLIAKLEAVRKGLGEVTDEKTLLRQINDIIAGQEGQVGARLKELIAGATEDLLAPKIVESPPVSLATLGQAKGTLKIDFGLEFEGELRLTFQAPPGSELTLPAELKVQSAEEPATVTYDIRAGTKRGEFPVRVVPSAGKPVTAVVTVK